MLWVLPQHPPLHLPAQLVRALLLPRRLPQHLVHLLPQLLRLPAMPALLPARLLPLRQR